MLKRSIGVVAIAAVLVACSTQGARERLLLPVLDALSEQPGFQAGGLDPDQHVNGVVVYWKGEVEEAAQAIVRDARRREIAVTVIGVSHSYDELREIAGRLVLALSAKGIELDGYRIGDPYDEIAVWGTDLDTSADVRRVAEAIAADVLPPGLTLAILPAPAPAIPA